MRIFFYLAKEIYVSFLGVLTILMFIFLSGRFVKHLANAASGQFPSDIIFSIMLYRLPEFLEILLPLSLFLGLMLAFGRLYVESEMVVLHACGVSKRRLIFLTLAACFPVMIIFSLITLYLTPLGLYNYQKLWENPENKMSFSTVVSGSFKKIGSNGMTLYAGEVSTDKSTIRDVFAVIGYKDADNRTAIDLIKAKEAQLSYGKYGNQYIELVDGTRITGGDNNLNYTYVRFDLLGRLIEQSKHIAKDVTSIDALPTLQLMQMHSREAKTKLQWRIGLPFMIPVIALIGLAFSETNHRKGRYLKLIPSIILYFIYFGMITATFSFMASGTLPVDIGLWPIHGLFFVLGLFVFYFSDLQRLRKNRS